MKKTRFSPPAVGGSSLLVVFAVLTLAVLALLCVTSVKAQQRMASASHTSVTAYYEADLKTQEIFARLRLGELPPGVETDGEIYRFACPISENRKLVAEVAHSEDGWQVLRWQTVTAEFAAEDDTLPVWDGYEEE